VNFNEIKLLVPFRMLLQNGIAADLCRTLPVTPCVLRYEGRDDLGCYERIRTGDNSMRHDFVADDSTYAGWHVDRVCVK